MIPGQGAKIPHASWPKNQNIKNRSNVVTNSISTLKMVHVKKKKPYREKNRPEFRGWGNRRAETTSQMRASSWLGQRGRWMGWTEAKAWVKKEQGL